MGLIRGVARTAVIAGTATAVSNRVSRRQAGRWAQQQPTEQSRQPQQAASPDPVQDRIEKLKALADLKAQGILTDEEFQAQKDAILHQ